VRLDDFRRLVQRLVAEVPREYLEGVVAVDVSAKTVPHPVHGDVYTLGECIPLEWSGPGAELQSRVVLYHGSFAALARRGAFDWRAEAWETLVHELRHHLEWRANSDALAAYDWAADENFKRRAGRPFDPAFYRAGEAVARGVYRVDDDVFIELGRRARPGAEAEFVWHGRRYRTAPLPPATRAGAFLTVRGLAEPPPGDLVLVLPPPPRRALAQLLHLGRPRPPAAAVVTARPLDG
jgi:hypothetical protein